MAAVTKNLVDPGDPGYILTREQGADLLPAGDAPF